MKVILSESRFESVFSELLKKEKFNIDISWYGSDVSSEGDLIIKGLAKFSQGDTPRNIERIGYSQGHIFSYKKKGDELILRKISPNIENYFDGKLAPGQKIQCKLQRIGDLIHQIYLKIDLPQLQSINFKRCQYFT